MYAVIESGGKQYRVELGTEFEVDRLEAQPGQSIDFERVLLVVDQAEAAIGRPTVAGARVSADVVRQTRGDKIVVFHYRPKARKRTKQGHRADLTVLRISDIVLDGKSAKELGAAAKAESDRQAAKDAAAAERLAAADQALASKLAGEAAEAKAAADAKTKADTKADAKAKADTQAKAKAAPKPKATGAKTAGTAAKAKPAAKPSTKAAAAAPKTTASRTQAPPPAAKTRAPRATKKDE